ncbi:unnamed protein product [Cladocopium goreaui]|uniref:Uncharacterized protein n=1 Tax=Cladocopium goreaui TaxID=2562237 RepID=A0A9P1FY49_9DINO|nr:unnamed protein product [Cladocopium goreaui]
MVETSYDDLLKTQLKQLHEVLLRAHQEETRLMKQQLLSGRDVGSAQSCLLKEAPGMPY